MDQWIIQIALDSQGVTDFQLQEWGLKLTTFLIGNS